MASKRVLKKRIKRIAGIFVADALIMSDIYPQKDDKIQELLDQTQQEYQEVLDALNHRFFRGKRLKKHERYQKRKEAKSLYKKQLKENVENFMKAIDHAYKEFGNLIDKNE
ncbi:MAG: DUF3435 domain-containing protein [Bacteroidales bacterium]|nr:DUF3435 domain-containing protein [Bacteroidales bacterium]